MYKSVGTVDTANNTRGERLSTMGVWLEPNKKGVLENTEISMAIVYDV